MQVTPTVMLTHSLMPLRPVAPPELVKEGQEMPTDDPWGQYLSTTQGTQFKDLLPAAHVYPAGQAVH